MIRPTYAPAGLVLSLGLGALGCGSSTSEGRSGTRDSTSADSNGRASYPTPGVLQARSLEGGPYYIGHSLLEDPLPGLVNMMAIAGGAVSPGSNAYAAQIGGGFPLFMHWSHQEDAAALKDSINDLQSEGPVVRRNQLERLQGLRSGGYGAVVVTEEYGYADSYDESVRGVSHFFARLWHQVATQARPDALFFVYENWNEGFWYPGTRVAENGETVDYFDLPRPDAFVEGVVDPSRYRFELRVQANGAQWRDFVQTLLGGPIEFVNPGWVEYDGPTVAERPDSPEVAFIPAGTALAELVRRIRAGTVPGASLFGDVSSPEACEVFNEQERNTPVADRDYRFLFDPCYAGGPPDYAHLTPLGMYVPALVTAAVVYHIDPRGITAALRRTFDLDSLQYNERQPGEFPRGEAIPLRLPDDELAEAMEAVAWDVITSEALTGFPIQF